MYRCTYSEKMYKSRLTKWKLDNKNNKTRHMQVIMRKKVGRDVVGKRSAFSVRGQPVELAEVHRYIERRARYARDEEGAGVVANIKTPASLCEWTPPSSPDAASLTTRLNADTDKHLLSRARRSFIPAVAGSDKVLCHMFSPRFWKQPNLFETSEYMFWNIHRYISGYVRNAIWVLQDQQILVSTKSAATFPNIGDTQCNLAHSSSVVSHIPLPSATIRFGKRSSV